MPIIKIDPSLHINIIDMHERGDKPSIIGKIYNVTEDTIRNILNSHGKYKKRTSRKYAYSQDYFSKIDTEEKAYFLGLLYSDGCNSGEGFTISLCEPDQYLLERLKIAMDYTGSITKLKKRKPFHKQKYRITLFSMRLSQDLTNLGCMPNKSLILRLPVGGEVPETLMSHFIRGCFDGDGSIVYSTKENKLISGITSSPYFCHGLDKYINANLGFSGMIHRYKHSAANDIKWSTRRGLVLLDYLYSNSSIRMSRKFDKFIDFLSKYHPKRVGGTDISVETMILLRDKWLGITKVDLLPDSHTRVYKSRVYRQ